MLDAQTRKRLRAIAHHLDPIVIIAEQGLTPGVIAETHRALQDHELIKTKIALDDREARTELAQRLCAEVDAQLVQQIGKTLVVYRANPKANPKLSNIVRYS